MTVEILGQSRTIASRDIRHSEPVDRELEQPPPPARRPQPVQPEPSSVPPDRALSIAGAALLVSMQVLALGGGVVLFVALVTRGFTIGVPTYASGPHSNSALRPPIPSLQSHPKAGMATLLRF